MMDLVVGCYSDAQAMLGRDNTAVVRISLGKPRWYPNGGDDLPFVKALAPAGWYFGEKDPEVFERRYRHQLHRTTVQRVLADLHAVAEETGASRLVLCCFEQNAIDCHRQMFCRWWMEKTGEWIDDLSEIGAGV